MTGKAAPGSAATAHPKTLADKVNWVLDTAHTASRPAVRRPGGLQDPRGDRGEDLHDDGLEAAQRAASQPADTCHPGAGQDFRRAAAFP